jgi:hypothetical protein
MTYEPGNDLPKVLDALSNRTASPHRVYYTVLSCGPESSCLLTADCLRISKGYFTIEGLE